MIIVNASRLVVFQGFVIRAGFVFPVSASPDSVFPVNASRVNASLDFASRDNVSPVSVSPDSVFLVDKKGKRPVFRELVSFFDQGLILVLHYFRQRSR
ncbi:hypothetical protein SPSIL_010280 [Sporomusa silvacetica DSM 10669]|uniref:Uncharacterized protein n=1 Tax=Sporomusa silvacetica DSM 10669 TaxID=1123289 RepID=A0ABZ3IHL5_9FIRM|nr:hypothetical protein SPSIL_10630 [Sporomusa silvacetica DSM 10669]